MTNIRTHGWTLWERALAAVYAGMCVVVGVFAFIEIYLTVTHLVHPFMGDWAWIVPAAAEGLFTALYAGWMLLELRDAPPRPVVWLLAALLTVAAGGSYWLNVYAARGVVPDAVAHVIVVTAFYGVLLFAKVLVRRLKVTPGERALEAGMAHARQYAIDLVRAVRGRGWRWNVPSLLRRQILSGRLCDAVREDVRVKVAVGRTSGWEESVRGWVFGPDGLALAALASEASRIALSEIGRDGTRDEPGSQLPVRSEETREGAAEHAPGEPETAPQTTSGARPQARGKRASAPALRLTAARSRSMSPDRLAEHVEAMIAKYGNAAVSVNRIKTDLSVGTDKAKAAREIALRNMARVVQGPFGERAQA